MDAGVGRDALQTHMLEMGVETGTHYKPLHWLSLYSVGPKGPTPHLDGIGKRILTIPCHARMCRDLTERVIHAMETFKPGS